MLNKKRELSLIVETKNLMYKKKVIQKIEEKKKVHNGAYTHNMHVFFFFTRLV
jgi:hypothetical protein